MFSASSFTGEMAYAYDASHARVKKPKAAGSRASGISGVWETTVYAGGGYLYALRTGPSPVATQRGSCSPRVTRTCRQRRVDPNARGPTSSPCDRKGDRAG